MNGPELCRAAHRRKAPLSRAFALQGGATRHNQRLGIVGDVAAPQGVELDGARPEGTLDQVDRGRRLRSWMVVVLKRLGLTPMSPAFRITRAARLRPQGTLASLSSAWT